MPRARNYRHHKRMRHRLRAETECHALMERRKSMHSKPINREIDLGDLAMVDVL